MGKELRGGLKMKFYNIIYYASVSDYLLSKSGDEHCKDLVRNIIVTEDNGCYVLCMCLNNTIITTDSIEKEKLGKINHYVDMIKMGVKKEKLQLSDDELWKMVEWMQENKKLCYSLDLIDGEYHDYRKD